MMNDTQSPTTKIEAVAARINDEQLNLFMDPIRNHLQRIKGNSLGGWDESSHICPLSTSPAWASGSSKGRVVPHRGLGTDTSDPGGGRRNYPG